MGIFGAAPDGGEQKGSPFLKSVTHILQWWNLALLTLSKEDPKDIWTTWHSPGVLLTSAFFQRKSANFAISRKYRYTLHFDTWFLIILTLFESLELVLKNMVTILMMSAKMAFPGLLKIKVFWNKGYDVIISVHELTNKFLSPDSNYVVDVVMWPKFGNSSISFLTSIL